MIAEKEILKQLDYSSSEEEFIEYDDSKENSANLNLRKSKIGQFQSKTTSNKRKSKRSTHKDKKKIEEKKDVMSNHRASKAVINTDTSRDLKNPPVPKAGYITSGRLTTGIRGIFGNSKSSNLVKRRGKISTIDISRRKIPEEVRDRVNQNLERILKNAYFDIQKSATEHSTNALLSDEEDRQPPVLVENRAAQKRPSRVWNPRKSNGSTSACSSSTSGHSAITPPPQLSSEIPYEEISRRLKVPLKISHLFPGKSYLEELREEIVKCFKQKVSILHDEEKASAQKTTPVSRQQNISLTSVAKQRFHDLSSTRTCDQLEKSSNEAQVIIPSGRAITEPNTAAERSILKALANVVPSTDAGNTLPFCGTEDTDRHLSLPFNDIHAADGPIFSGQGFTILTNMDHPNKHALCTFNNPQNFVLKEHAKSSTTNPTSQCRTSNIPQQQQPHLHDSGTYSSESTAREYKRSSSSNTNMRRIEVSQSPFLPGYNNGFLPRRRGSRDSRKSFPFIDCSQLLDHDYAHHSSTLDILHYAGTVDNDMHMESAVEEDDHNSSSKAHIYVPTLKKPCLDTPSPPIQFYRRKMF